MIPSVLLTLTAALGAMASSHCTNCTSGSWNGTTGSAIAAPLSSSLVEAPPSSVPVEAPLSSQNTSTPNSIIVPLTPPPEPQPQTGPCKPGFKSDGVHTCYKQYPEFEANGQRHTITSITKSIKVNPAKGVPNACPAGKSKSGGLCYADCRQGWIGHGAVCYQGCGLDTVVGALCRKKCTEGWHEVAGVCWQGAKSYVPKTYVRGQYTRGAGTPVVCAEGLDYVAGLCYAKCPEGYQQKSAGLCSQICPEGARDFGVGCSREMHRF